MESLLDGIAAHPYVLALVGVATVLLYTNSEGYKLRNVPTVGFSDVPLLSFITFFQFLVRGGGMVDEGYNKYKGRAFKVPFLTRWMVVFTGLEQMEELRKSPDDTMSFVFAMDETLQVKYTMGAEITDNPYHIPIVRGQLTRNLPVVFPALKDELTTSFDEIIPPTTEWKKYKAMDTFIQIIARASNRTFVGLPLCRDPGFLKIGINFTIDVIKVSGIMGLLPAFLWPMASYVLNTSTSINRAMKYLEPIIEERRSLKEKLGDEYDTAKPVDFLSWLMDEAEGDEQSVKKLTTRILTMNFAAIHTSTITFIHALYFLAAYSKEYIEPLRAEVEAAVAEDGWSKAALDKMRKVDSFVRESQRLHPLGSLMSTRVALKDHTFSDGTFIPKGTMISLPTESTQTDEANYENPHQFDGFRFAKMSERDPGSRRYDLVAAHTDYLAFGHGRHTCPGRFFAAQELKILLAHVVVNYDVKFENEGVRPADIVFAQQRIPNPKAEVMFRKRTKTSA